MNYYVTYPRWIYVLRYGELVKIGRTESLSCRMTSYLWEARRDGVGWGLVDALLPHPEAGRNEQALVTQFRKPDGPRTEYLDVPLDEVLAAVHALPCSHHGGDRWMHARHEEERSRMLARHRNHSAPVPAGAS